jgi:hypothetical protein
MFISFRCNTDWTKYILEGEVFDNRGPRFEIEVVCVALGLGSKSSLTVEAKQCIATRCRAIERRLLRLLALKLFAEEHFDAGREVLRC